MNTSTIIKLYNQMVYIRKVEEKLAEVYPQQDIRCPVHLCIGQEAISVGICMHLSKNDFVLSTHRSHGHYLAKGGNLMAMFSEIYGKASGCAKGRGGSMHLIDLSVGFLGSTPIVGNIIPVATGVAFAEKLRRGKRITVVFFGDAAIEEGVFSEALNFAILKKLPIIYVCENNLYSVYTHLSERQPKRAIVNISKGYGVKSFSGDGNNVFDVSNIMKKATHIIKNDQGPVFIELLTYRWREHCGPNFDNQIGYRTEKEYLRWKKLDPISRLIRFIITKRVISQNKLQSIDTNITKAITKTILAAKNSRFPEKPLSMLDVYAP